MPQSVDTLLQLLGAAKDATVTGLLVVMVWGVLNRKWVPWHFYDAMRQDRDNWRRAALRGTHILDEWTKVRAKKESEGEADDSDA